LNTIRSAAPADKQEEKILDVCIIQYDFGQCSWNSNGRRTSTMSFVKWIRDGIAHPRVAIYLKVIAVLMLLSALSHLGSIMGIMGGSWVAKPWLFRIADLLLLPISLVMAWGLWRTMFWAVVAWPVLVVLFQAVPFLFFSEFFASGPGEQTMHYGQVGFHVIMLGILLVLLPRKKGT
jgi:hypothetical protein